MITPASQNIIRVSVSSYVNGIHVCACVHREECESLGVSNILVKCAQKVQIDSTVFHKCMRRLLPNAICGRVCVVD